jgi:hypothetical protein
LKQGGLEGRSRIGWSLSWKRYLERLSQNRIIKHRFLLAGITLVFGFEFVILEPEVGIKHIEHGDGRTCGEAFMDSLNGD